MSKTAPAYHSYAGDLEQPFEAHDTTTEAFDRAHAALERCNRAGDTTTEIMWGTLTERAVLDEHHLDPERPLRSLASPVHSPVGTLATRGFEIARAFAAQAMGWLFATRDLPGRGVCVIVFYDRGDGELDAAGAIALPPHLQAVLLPRAVSLLVKYSNRLTSELERNPPAPGE